MTSYEDSAKMLWERTHDSPWDNLTEEQKRNVVRFIEVLEEELQRKPLERDRPT